MKTPSSILACFALIALAGMSLRAADAAAEIESLLASIKNLKDASFIRNGEKYTPSEAESHLRMKWSKAGSHVKTAEDFIALCATKSSFSGKPYLIRAADGSETEAAKFLTARLKEIRSGKK